jgi:hypothetical protein
MNSATIISKQETFYIAYAPDFDVSAYGVCRDEAINNLQIEVLGQAEHYDLPVASPRSLTAPA